MSDKSKTIKLDGSNRYQVGVKEVFRDSTKIYGLRPLRDNGQACEAIEIKSGGGQGGTSNYEELENLPKINHVELKGDLTAEALDLASQNDLQAINTAINNKADKSQLADKADKSELPVIATNNNVGLVKPDGTSITITDDGTISSVGGGDTDTPITPLEYAETINLAIDHVYKLVATGNVTFVLPTVENPTTLPQILIQFKMNTVVTINLGTTSFFKKVAPDMSTAGIYNIIYEYDTNNNVWVVDAIAKGEVV